MRKIHPIFHEQNKREGKHCFFCTKYKELEFGRNSNHNPNDSCLKVKMINKRNHFPIKSLQPLFDGQVSIKMANSNLQQQIMFSSLSYSGSNYDMFVCRSCSCLSRNEIFPWKVWTISMKMMMMMMSCSSSGSSSSDWEYLEAADL